MAKKEPEKWITVNGVHIPIYEGESEKEAIKRVTQKQVSRDNKKVAKSNSEKLVAKDKDAKIEKLKQELENAKGFRERASIRRKIEMLQEDWEGSEEEFIAHRRKKQEQEEAQKQKEREARKRQEDAAKKAAEQKRKQELERELKTHPKEKVEQFKIVQENNPLNDDYHVGIRKPSDIKTWKEAMQDEDSFEWGDFSKKDAQKALEKGTITIYSSYPIKQGVFVSTSKIQSEQYAGGEGSKVYSKTVPLADVAWINGDEGQFAQIKKKK